MSLRPLRILVLNWQDRENPQAGGAEIHLHETFGRLAWQGWDVTLVSSGWRGAAPETVLDGIRVHRTGGRHSYPLRVAGHVARAFADEAPFDLVVEDLNKVPLFAPTWAPAPTVLLVHHLFGATAFQEASFPVAAATWLLERPIARVYRGLPVVAVSDSTRADLAARGLPPEGVQVIPNGIDLEHFTPGPGGPDAHRFPEPTLLYLGRLKRYKRVDLVLKTLAELASRGVPARLVVAGKGDHGDALREEARRLGLGPGQVHFAGFVSETEKLRLLRGAWVHLFTSPKEGWGIANLEAAACGTPTVASDAPGLRDSVRHGETGFLVPHGDVQALADRVAALLSDPGLRRRQAEGARRFAEGFSWDRSAEAMGLALHHAVGYL
jgi:glycosyltransferase involved in cell wall biosynthesis